MKFVQKIIVGALIATVSLSSMSAMAQAKKSTKAPAPAEPALAEQQLSQEQQLELLIQQNYRACRANAEIFGDIAAMRQGGLSEADAKKKVDEFLADADKEAKDNLQPELYSLVESFYKNQPVQDTDEKKAGLVRHVEMFRLYECALESGARLAQATATQ